MLNNKISEFNNLVSGYPVGNNMAMVMRAFRDYAEATDEDSKEKLDDLIETLRKAADNISIFKEQYI